MKKLFTLLFSVIISVHFYAQKYEYKTGEWKNAGKILASIKEPVFPNREFKITDYGAVEGGKQDCTDAIKRAIEKCSSSGGGKVVVPEGIYLTGAIYLKSNVNLHLLKNSTLLFSTDPKAYMPVVFTRWEGTECMNFSPFIYAFKEKNIAVTGEGTLDGGASDANWWAWARRGTDGKSPATVDVKALNELSDKGVPVEKRIFGERHYLRPNFFAPNRCQNVMIEGLTIVRSPMWEINPVLCTNVIVRGLKITSHGPNNDGCDPEASKNVLIENCLFDTGDDCIAIKSGRNDDGRRVGVAVENLIIRGCTMKDGHAGVAIGSEIAGGCRNVFIENCKMDSPNLDRALRFKSNARRGGVVENIFMRNVEVGKVSEAFITVDFLYEEGPKGNFMPAVRNVYVENVTAKAAPRLFFIAGFQGATIDNIKIANSKFYGLTASELVDYAGKIILDNVTIVPAQKVKSLSSRAQTGNNEAAGKVVALDYFFNHELKKDKDGKEFQFHYTWEDKENSGFYELGKLIENMGAGIYEMHNSPTLAELNKTSLYIIADPDTPQETVNPNYISDSAAVEIEKWVKNGGVLALFANDIGNCEFEHLNKLAERFGIHFNEVSRNRLTGTDFYKGKFDKLPDHPIFKNVKSIYLKEISTLKLSSPAEPILTDNNDIIMAGSSYGKGFVFAVGDPWIYNEYYDNRKLPAEYENYKAAKNLFEWLLGKAKKVR